MKLWNVVDNEHYLNDESSKKEKIDNGVYILSKNPKTGQLYLSFEKEKFSFPFKVYGLERGFIDRVKKSYHSTTGNFGIHLSGVKGTGKTVTAQMICNELEQPVIIVSKTFPDIPEFVSSIPQKVIILIDEYEKLYKEKDEYGDVVSDSSLLTLMDGVLNSEQRKVFIFTTNEKTVNQNLINRPGRIRYVKEYEDLTLVQIGEIVDDRLIYPEHKESIFDFLKTADIITVDIVKTICDEVNIFNEPADVCGEFLNIYQMAKEYEIKIYKTNGDLHRIMTIHDMEYGTFAHAMESFEQYYVRGVYITPRSPYKLGHSTEIGISGEEDYTMYVAEVKISHKSFLF